MKLLPIFIFLSIQSLGQQKGDTTAKHFTDSAVAIFRNTGDPKKALPLLEQATKIDSNYFRALSTKFSLEMASEMPDEALVTAKRLIKLKPEVGEYYTAIGIIYEGRQDTVSSKIFFMDAIACYDRSLDTMSKANKHRNNISLNKAFNLILLGQQKSGNDILEELYDGSHDEIYKGMIKSFMNKSRKEILEKLK